MHRRGDFSLATSVCLSRGRIANRRAKNSGSGNNLPTQDFRELTTLVGSRDQVQSMLLIASICKAPKLRRKRDSESTFQARLKREYRPIASRAAVQHGSVPRKRNAERSPFADRSWPAERPGAKFCKRRCWRIIYSSPVRRALDSREGSNHELIDHPQFHETAGFHRGAG